MIVTDGVLAGAAGSIRTCQSVKFPSERSGFGPIFVVNAQRSSDFDDAAPKTDVNHGIVTVFGTGPISEFLIVGCQHGWLYGIGYDREGFEYTVIRTVCDA